MAFPGAEKRPLFPSLRKLRYNPCIMKAAALLLLLFFSLALPAPAQQGDAPQPCLLKRSGLPAFFGARLDMPFAEARKLFKRPRIILGTAKKPILYQVSAAELKQQGPGIEVSSLEFAAKLDGKVDSIGLIFSSRQKAASRELFEKVAELSGIPSDSWKNDQNHGESYISWIASCQDFHAQFVAQKGFLYKLSVYSTFAPKAKEDMRGIAE